MFTFGRNIILLLCFGLMAGCAGIPVSKKDVKDVRAYHAAKVLFQPNACGSGGDSLTGNYSEGFPGIGLPPGSPAASYSFDYGSLAGLSGTGSYSLEPQPNGSIILTLPDGTKILFVPTGTLNPELTGNLPQFEHVAGYQSVINLAGGQYTLTEKDGTKTTFTKLNGVYRPSALTDRNGGTLSYAYNASGNLTGITDVHGRNINITYNAAGKPQTVSDFTNRSASYEYDGSGNLTKATDMDGSQTVYSYDAQNRMTGITYPNGAHKTMTYDGQNRVLSIAEDGGNNAQTFEYIDASSQTKVTDALNYQTVYDYISVDGKKEITKITDPAGNITRYGYDEDLNRISVTDALNRKTNMVYDGRGNMISVKDPLGNMTQMLYEPTFNQVTSVIDPKWNTTSMRYDLRGNVMEVSDAQGNKTQMSYDALGHVTGTNDPLGNTSLFEYDGNGALKKVTDPLGRMTTMTRDTLSRVTQTVDPKNKLTLFEYDVKGNLTKVTDALNGITQYGYTGGCPSCGGGDLLASVKDAKAQTTNFAYDLQKRLTSVTNPLNQSKSFVYDKKGNLTSVTDAKGQTITFEYDMNDRLTVKHLPEGNVTYTYDAVGNLTVAVGLLSDAVAFTYDALNRVTQTQETISGVTYTIGYAHDANGNRTSMTTPWGNYNYSYDSLNRLTSLTNPDAKTVTFAYDALGRRTKMTLPNGTETTYAYDGGSQLTQILHRKTADNTALAFSNYGYDLAGNRTSMEDITGTHGYEYDDLYRLTGANHPGNSAVEPKAETFAYDPVGNRTTDAERTGYTYDAANRLVADSSYTYTYDANGNLTSKRPTSDLLLLTSYSYNSENQLTSATMPDTTVVTFKYDPLGRRIEKTSGSTAIRYVYDNEDIIAGLDVNNAVTANFTHGPGVDEPLIMKKTDTNANYYYHADGLGSIIALSDNNGAIVETIEYQAYGKPIIKDRTGAVFDKSIVGNPYLFTARELDSETGLFYYRARYYGSETGRFLQEEPSLILTGENRYIYASCRPVYWIDPLGDRFIMGGIFLWINLCATSVIFDNYEFAISGTRDTHRHCVLSSEITRRCGALAANYAAYLKEFLDEFGFGTPDADDFAADFTGIDIGRSLLKLTPPSPCGPAKPSGREKSEEECTKRGYGP